MLGIDFAKEALALGVLTGMVHGLMAVGLVLIYRSNRVINFAHGQIGAFAAAVFGALVSQGELHYWIAFPVAIGLGASLGAGSEFLVVRRLSKAPKIMSAVATIALSQLLVPFTLLVNIGASAGSQFPLPRWMPERFFGALFVHGAYFAILIFTPLIVLGLTIFLKRSRYGLGIRAAASNSDAARLAAVSSNRMSTIAWAIAGAVSAYTAILLFPSQSFIDAEVLGPALLLRALTAAVLARMTSLPIALAGGIGVGLLENIVLWNFPRAGGSVSAILFAVILVGLLLQTRKGGREREGASWAAVQAWEPLPEALRSLASVRRLGKTVAAVALVIAMLVPVFATNALSIIFVGTLSYMVVGLSLGVATGLGGQLSLGQFAIAGVGAAASYHVSLVAGVPIGMLFAGLAGAGISLLIGIPALRIRGLMLTVATLGFALAAQDWLFDQSWMMGDVENVGRPILPVVGPLDGGKEYYLWALFTAVLVFLLARNVWRGGIGRRMRAARDNEDALRAFTVSATRVKLEGFAIAGFIAGVGGAIYGHSLAPAGITAEAFLVIASFEIAIVAVLGGLGVLVGPLLGALYVHGARELPLDNAALVASSLGILLVLLYFPGGIASTLKPLRNRVIDWFARRDGLDPVAIRADLADEAREAAFVLPAIRVEQRRPTSDVLLEVQDLHRTFGGIKAVAGVSFDVKAGEVLGLIGPNGAGKTTTFELISGFTAPDAGRVRFDAKDITNLGPEERGRLGLIRSFQDAALFPTLTTLEVVMLSLERSDPTPFARSLLGSTKVEARHEAKAREYIGAMGLHDFRNKQIRELSTGTRRITELACLIALEPRLLLLDEPSSGIAQRETEALGELLAGLRRDLDLTMVVIEHDIPLVMGLSDRIVAMDTGTVLAVGSPHEVRNDPRVVTSYLGGDIAAIERSGATPSAATPSQPDGHDDDRCTAETRSGARCSRASQEAGLCRQHLAQVVRP